MPPLFCASLLRSLAQLPEARNFFTISGTILLESDQTSFDVPPCLLGTVYSLRVSYPSPHSKPLSQSICVLT